MASAVDLFELPIENLASIFSYLTLFEVINLSRVCSLLKSSILPSDGMETTSDQQQQPPWTIFWRSVSYCYYPLEYVDLGRKKKKIRNKKQLNNDKIISEI